MSQKKHFLENQMSRGKSYLEPGNQRNKIKLYSQASSDKNSNVFEYIRPERREYPLRQKIPMNNAMLI